MKCFISLVLILAAIHRSAQLCSEENSYNGITVKWKQSETAVNVVSEPLCYMEGVLVQRNCTGDQWSPAVEDLKPCMKVVKTFDNASCPPKFHKISEYNNDYCYHVDDQSIWNYPCFTSGGGSVITDLDNFEIDTLLNSLKETNVSRYFWLPAQRQKSWIPVVWSIPGPNWGALVSGNEHLKYVDLLWKNCLALDIQKGVLTTDYCNQKYPSLCFYINDVHYSAKCPDDYAAFRFTPNYGTCFGIEKADSEGGYTFDTFIQKKCKKPMNNLHDMSRFVFAKIAHLTVLENDTWCWIDIASPHVTGKDANPFHMFQGIINNIGTIGLVNSSFSMSCMACVKEVIYGETQLMFEYNELDNKIYLTIYFPSGLWKYDNNDKGIQCFSDANGFVKVIDINDLPYLVIRDETESGIHEKIVYIIDLVTEWSAQYWCEGHTFNFSLISTEKLVVNPKGNDIHVFALSIQCYNFSYMQNKTDLDWISVNLKDILNAQKILLMDIYDFTDEHITVLFHVHMALINNNDTEALNIHDTYNFIKEKVMIQLPKLNCSFICLKSSIYCLPSTSSYDTLILEWELTPIGHMSAPKQFCLQSNGLPVKRQCLGSYLNGGMWGNVEGFCDSNYIPTHTTTFLYSVIKRQLPFNYTSNFLTVGLGYVLKDIEIIIPADIYYLSMSLQQILQIAEENKTSVDIGDIENIAWVMDRVMDLDYDYLRLAQTLNSTNVILNSVNNIIEIIAKQLSNQSQSYLKLRSHQTLNEETYKLAVKPQFVVQISYPKSNNITGLVISRISDSDKFTDMKIKPLYSNTTLDDIMSIQDLEVATWLPTNLLDNLRPNGNESVDSGIETHSPHIIVSVFQNDIVFQELIASNHKINSRIIGVSIPGYNTNFEHPLPIIFKQLNHVNSSAICSYWDFEMQKPTLYSGVWKTQGCFPLRFQGNISICQCYHLTHFSQLITIPSNIEKNEQENTMHAMALNIITLVGCFLSMLGTVGIWLTALLFTTWRKKAGTKVLLQLSASISLPSLFIIVFTLDNTIFIIEDDHYVISQSMKPFCIVLGSLLHYSILASFMWMLITGVLQFIRYVRVLGVSRPSRFMLKFALIGWGIPMLPVAIVLLLDSENYVPAVSYSKKICYPHGNYFLTSVLFPICVILIINVTLFILVLYSISRGKNENMKSTDIDLVKAQLRLSIFLFFLLGLTWIFGVFSFSSNLIWSYLFCLTSTVQGFVLFIYFIICDPSTRNMWIILVKPPFTSRSSRNSLSSIS